MEILGETQDDAVGEAFDKIAKIIGLPYPGGPMIDSYAKEGNPHAFQFPETEMQGFNYSFSGIKTAVLYFLQRETKKDENFVKNNLNDICASVQHRLVTTLLQKLKKASKHTGIRQIAIAGGVSANSYLRKILEEEGEQLDWQVYIPKFEYCTDNAGMIAMTAHYKYLQQDFLGMDASPQPRMKFSV